MKPAHSLQPLPPSPTDPLSSLALSTYTTLTDILLGATAGPLEAYRQLSKTKTQAQAELDAQDDPYRPVPDLAPPRVSEDAASSYACPTPPPGSSDDSGTLHALSDVDMDSTTAVAGNPYAAVAVSSGLGVARIVGAGLKAPGVYTRGLARGFHNVPRLYGDETVRREEEVEGVVGGLVAAGKVGFLLLLFVIWMFWLTCAKGLGYGLYDGISGFFVQPVVGAQKEGALGFLKGFGKGLGGVICKPAAGELTFFRFSGYRTYIALCQELVACLGMLSRGFKRRSRSNSPGRRALRNAVGSKRCCRVKMRCAGCLKSTERALCAIGGL